MTLLATLRVKETYLCYPREERKSAICVRVYVCFCDLCALSGKESGQSRIWLSGCKLPLLTWIPHIAVLRPRLPGSFPAQPGLCAPARHCNQPPLAAKLVKYSQTPISQTHADSIYDKCSISVFVRLYELQKPACSKLNWCWTVNSGMLPLCWRHNRDSCFLRWQTC